MKFPKEYMEDLLVRMSHHSNGLENNTITLEETVSIILHNVIPSDISFRELYEIDNHRYAMEYLFDDNILNEAFTFDTIFRTHEILMDRIHHERGTFKKNTNYIKGADFDTTPPEQTYIVMKQWLDNINFKIEIADNEADVIEAVCEGHIEFERIHPFADGNAPSRPPLKTA